MAKFLNTSATTYYLEELIKSASDRVILISPYLKLSTRIKELLIDKNRLKIDVRIVYGKSELKPAEINWLKDLSFIRVSYCANLHAKVYLNEKEAIVTSLNLYEFSMINNNEVGIYISRDDDSDVYRDAYDEAQRLIRISEEVRMSLEHVAAVELGSTAIATDSNVADVKSNQTDGAAGKLIPTSKLAQRKKISTQECLVNLHTKGFLSDATPKAILTKKAEDYGAQHIKKSRFGPYFKFPEEILD